jgi:hypothetical protein
MTRHWDGSLHRLALARADYREAGRRARRWKRRKALKAPLLWLAAAFVAFLGWLGRSK